MRATSLGTVIESGLALQSALAGAGERHPSLDLRCAQLVVALPPRGGRKDVDEYLRWPRRACSRAPPGAPESRRLARCRRRRSRSLDLGLSRLGPLPPSAMSRELCKVTLDKPHNASDEADDQRYPNEDRTCPRQQALVATASVFAAVAARRGEQQDCLESERDCYGYGCPREVARHRADCRYAGRGVPSSRGHLLDTRHHRAKC
jgi:hypothetical protein